MVTLIRTYFRKYGTLDNSKKNCQNYKQINIELITKLGKKIRNLLRNK